ncbi:hypothetical protein GYMLUDRAFT_252912 [Collybiopsis luxurians FD-317 M1]|uniref:Uncharacterized protein n=1 Tax=Collybiopsis luxurians FD-317 M1 TaxID=944289 RepID=A0A0D0B8S0_9AGAR|nr:hypothetical protein GYMLUDRAFT_252912 [Collybiopsis luxurians FD-317 M1]
MGDIPIVLQEPEASANEDGLPIYLLYQSKKFQNKDAGAHPASLQKSKSDAAEGGQGNDDNNDNDKEEQEEAEGMGKGLDDHSAEEEEANDSTQINISKSKLVQDKNPMSSKTYKRTDGMPK